MKLLDLAARPLPSLPWHEGDNIPWDDPAFSARMLRAHLSQAHDAASRRATTIDRQVAWLHHAVLGEQPTAILDLGCGPGLYASRLARLGHRCVGIDFSPASIAHASAEATGEGLACRYQQADLRTADFGTGYGLVMLIFGELNVFPRPAAHQILTKAHAALATGGILVLEPHTFTAIQEIGQQPRSWYTAPGGLFADEPYLCLEEHFWHAALNVATTRYFIADLASGTVTRHAQSFQAYTEVEYRDLLRECGFTAIAFHPTLTGDPTPDQPNLCAIVARKA